MEESSYTKTQPLQDLDPLTVIELANTREVLREIWLDFTGLSYSVKGDKLVLKRETKPKFTYEFTKEFISDIHVASNRITGRSIIADRTSRLFLETMFETTGDMLNYSGMPNMITYDEWQGILELNKPDPDFFEENSNDILTYWQSLYGIDWHINDPVTVEMHQIVIEHFKLDKEKHDYESTLRNTHIMVMLYLETSVNRSLEGLYLEHERSTHTESITNRDNTSRSDESFLDRLKNASSKVLNVGGNKR